MAAKDKLKIANRAVFALDIGTRSIIGIVGVVEEERVKVIAIEREEHTKRAMIDGQIEDIDQVAKLAAMVKKRLEDKVGFPLKKVCIAAAGRALITQKGSYELQLPESRKIDPETICRLESGAISQAEAAFNSMESYDPDRQFFLVGYSVLSYSLDGYTISTLTDHKGRNLKADVVATFLPSEVVESLYTTMNKIGLEVASLTLEPIAALNASIPQDLRLLNLVMVDIGAGTSDIAACRDGGIIGYTMATLAGDEITETLMKQYLVDFQTAERIKFNLPDTDDVTFQDILGFEQTKKRDELIECIRKPLEALSDEIAKQIVELNNGVPSAVFLAGGGSKLTGLREALVKDLDMDPNRIAIAGNNFQRTSFSEEYDLNNPEYATPLGIAVSAGLNLINDSFRVTLNGRQAKLFKNGVLTVMDVLMMNGYGYQSMVGRSGKNILVHINGKRKILYGERSVPCVLKLNGQECKVTEIIHAGDSIEFQPAVHGKDARAILGDVLEPGARTAKINGVESPASTPLKTGDMIEIDEAWDSGEEPDEEGFTWEDYMDEEEEGPAEEAADLTKPQEEQPPSIETAASSSFSTQAAAAAAPLPDLMAASADTPAYVPTPMPSSAPASAPVPMPASTPMPAPQSPAPESAPKSPSPWASPSQEAAALPTGKAPSFSLNEFYLTLNDETLVLPRKSDGNPYYLMDILTYSSLDFDHLTGNVIITVNGKSATFLQKLQMGDTVVIRCE